jgi:hypothetical protein
VVNSLDNVELREESVVDELQAQSLCSTHVCDWLARNQGTVPYALRSGSSGSST